MSSLKTEAFSAETLRLRFPALQQLVNGKPLCYLDNAATTQKPDVVLDALDGYYRRDCANVHRGIHTLSVRADESFESAREAVRTCLNAPSAESVIFTSGTTAGINLVADCFGRAFVDPGDEILVTGLEHHSNLVPWQLLCQRSGARLVICPATPDGGILPEEFKSLLSDKTRIAAMTHVSNALGTILPVRDLTALAHQAGARVLIDGAQAVAHLSVDVLELDCDFYAFSGHKVFGPTGIGVLWGRPELLEQLPPWQGGGDMVANVGYQSAEFKPLPWRLEAGTPHIAGAIGMGAALAFLATLPREQVASHEQHLLEMASKGLDEMPGVKRIGREERRTSVLSFVVNGAHPSDVATLLDLDGVAVRSGHHCAQPLMEHLGLNGTVRASFACYNTEEDVKQFLEALRKTLRILGIKG